ncbi:MAG: threonine--tRNA ligase [Actinobacteria bacterium]|nr:threonine--tRNA ligase [Actinomycetota bacterium]
MEKISVILPDGARIELNTGSTAYDLAGAIGPRLRKAAVAAVVNDQLVDLSTQLNSGDIVSIVVDHNESGVDVIRHSTAHVMAQAVMRLYPNVKLGIGPTIEEGFYYDFDLEKRISIEDLAIIEAEMKRIVSENLIFEKQIVSKEEAKQIFKDQPYKIELIKEIADETVNIYRQGEFVDLCRGPHLPSTGRIKAFKLLSIAGAYWRGDERRPMLQRIYGTAFPSEKELKEHIQNLEEAERRDHRKLGRELDIFSIDEEFGAGLPLWHPKGAILRKVIEDFWKNEHLKRGYELITTPHIAKVDLWRTSGHWDFYRESMFSPMEVEGTDYVVKPMNCPGHIKVYKSHTRSYRELPIRWAELGTVYRFERSGVLHGLLRVRGFTQDDAHIFCAPDQIEDEILGVIELMTSILKKFGFEEYDVYLSTQPEKFVGMQENWDRATGALRMALEKAGLAYEIDPGEGVFYGPKIDVKIRDALGRSWQCTTIQVDFNLPDRFELAYIGADNQEHRPIMIHRAILGSLERFIGVLIEHYAGAFPVWISPEQVVVLPIADRHNDYAAGVNEKLRGLGARARVDMRTESVNKKIRDAQLQKIPYMLIIGDREVENKQVAVRDRSGNRGPVTFDAFIGELKVNMMPAAVDKFVEAADGGVSQA